MLLLLSNKLINLIFFFFHNICTQNNVMYPRYMSHLARSVLEGLMEKNPMKR
jgi:hypothetical protein